MLNALLLALSRYEGCCSLFRYGDGPITHESARLFRAVYRRLSSLRVVPRRDIARRLDSLRYLSQMIGSDWRKLCFRICVTA
jgi:hypothetical protein